MTIEKNTKLNDGCFIKSNFHNLKIREYEKVLIKQLIGLILTKIAGLSGVKTETDRFTIQDIKKMILSVFSNLTLEELIKAFELERYSMYEVKTEHFQLFNATYISTILNNYKKWKVETMYKANISSPIKQPSPMTESQKEKKMNEAVNRVYSEYKELKTMQENIVYIFDFLVERDKIKSWENSKYLKYYVKKMVDAKIQVENEQKAKCSNDPKERYKFKEELLEISEDKSPKIEIRAKKLVLIDFFDKQISLGQRKIF